MIAEHTSGPWEVKLGVLRGLHILIVGDTNYSVCKVYDQDEGMQAVNAANACLFAAAPDLLEALNAVSKLHGTLRLHDLDEIVQSALAKARGRA